MNIKFFAEWLFLMLLCLGQKHPLLLKVASVFRTVLQKNDSQIIKTERSEKSEKSKKATKKLIAKGQKKTRATASNTKATEKKRKKRSVKKKRRRQMMTRKNKRDHKLKQDIEDDDTRRKMLELAPDIIVEEQYEDTSNIQPNSANFYVLNKSEESDYSHGLNDSPFKKRQSKKDIEKADSDSLFDLPQMPVNIFKELDSSSGTDLKDFKVKKLQMEPRDPYATPTHRLDNEAKEIWEMSSESQAKDYNDYSNKEHVSEISLKKSAEVLYDTGSNELKKVIRTMNEKKSKSSTLAYKMNK